MTHLRKSVREALTSEQPALVHPDADVLTAYCEDLLAPTERDEVLAHLAACADCREVVSLVGAGVPEPKQDVTAIPAASRSSTKTMWAAAAVLAIIAIGAGVSYLQFSGQREVASTSPTAPAEEEAKSAPNEQAQLPNADETANAQKDTQSKSPQETRTRVADSRVDRSPAPNTPKQLRNDIQLQAQGRTQQNSGQLVAGSSIPPPPPPVLQQDSSHDSRQATTETPSAALAATAKAKSAGEIGSSRASASETIEVTAESAAVGGAPAFSANASAAGLIPVRAHWRITNSGGLERSGVRGDWHPMLKDSKVQFRVVSIIGTHVWAGGSAGELYHSRDNGETWMKVPLHANSAVASIRFDNERNGTVITADGKTWTTSDEGQNWIRR